MEEICSILSFLEGDCRVEKLKNQKGNTLRLPPPITVEIKHALDNIKEVELSAEGTEDKVIWNQTPTREYTLKSDWNAIRKTMPRVGWNKLLWHRQVIPRYASCVWKESPSQETMRDPRVPPASELGGRDTRRRTAVLCVLVPLNSSQQYARNRITEPSSNRNNRRLLVSGRE